MKHSTMQQKQLFYLSQATHESTREEFLIEFYDDADSLRQKGDHQPYKITRNFDELILFLEELE